MNIDETTYWLIHDYLKGNLSKDVKLQFEQEMRNNLDLQEEVEMHKLANKLIINNRLLAVEQASKETSAKLKHATILTRIFFSLLTLGTASVLLFITFNIQDPKPESVQNDEISLEEINKVVISSDTVLKQKDKTKKTKPKEKQWIENPAQVVLPPNESLNKLEPSKTTVEEAFSSSIVIPKETKTIKDIERKPPANSLSPVDKCNGITVSAEVSTSHSCHNAPTGTISLFDLRGGSPPYSYEIKNSTGKPVDRTKLAGGSYIATIMDVNQCKNSLENIWIKEVNCQEEEKAFNPFIGETFEVEGKFSGATFTVYEKGGKPIFEKTIAPGDYFQWNGMSMQGEVKAGYFYYEISHKDGTKTLGNVTITR